MKRTLVLSLLVFWLSGSTSPGGDKLFSGHRGINLTFRTRPTDQDLDRIGSWGVNLVRLVVHAEPAKLGYDKIYRSDGSTLNDDTLRELDLLIEKLRTRRIDVVLCLLDFPGSLHGLVWRDFRYWASLEALWRALALRYRTTDHVIACELMNEPATVRSQSTPQERSAQRRGTWRFPEAWAGTPRDYLALVERLGKAINEVAPEKFVIIPAVGIFGHPINFTWMRPVKVQKAAYTFHMYVPHTFTDAGKNGRRLTRYRSAKMRDAVMRAMEPVAAFAKENDAAIYVGELGLMHVNEGMGAKDWLRDVLDYLEARGWSWAYWTYSIDCRNPEVLLGADGSLSRRPDTERLTTLKTYWGRNGLQRTGLGGTTR